MTTRDEHEIGRLDALNQLPRSIEPARDLWPSIEARLDARDREAPPVTRGWGWQAVAASVALAFIIGLVAGRQAPETAPPAGTPLASDAFPAVMSVARASAPAMAAAVAASEREYQAAWKGFAPIGREPSLLAEETVDALGASWQAMKAAETALLAALEEHPDNPFLAEKLLELRGQQLDFMRALHMLDQNSRRNT